MFKNAKAVKLAVAAAAVCGTLALAALSPVSADSGFEAASSYLPEQIANQGTAVETVPADGYGDTGLSRTFPVESQASQEDAAPKMYY
jgi:hypothetical protein